MVAADYSQLELRVIAHLSGDHKLISILNADGDVFKMIAAQWRNTLPELVSPQDRQHAKQVRLSFFSLVFLLDYNFQKN
jgi:DNA polymerase I-like protein with 3'-5' exonuclease and polymerase domains